MPNAKDKHNITNHRILVLGDTGSGKTTQFLTLPGKKFAYLFDSNALLSLRGFDVDYEEFLPDRLNLNIKSLKKDAGGTNVKQKTTLLYDAWLEDFNAKLESNFFDAYDVIGFDSATTFLDMIMDRTLYINGRAGQWPQQDDYGPQMVAFTNVVRTLTSMNKPIYMTGHMELRQDELSKKIYRQPMMTGRLRAKIPLLFSDIFVSAVENDGSGKVLHKFQTVPDRQTLTVRTSIKGLDPWIDVSLDFNKELSQQGLGAILVAERT